VKLYLITLAGGGDIDLKLVDQETWDWIQNSDTGNADSPDETCWTDRACPETVKRRIYEKERTTEPYEEWAEENPMLTIGSWQNDRMLLAPAATAADGKELVFWSVSAAMGFCQKEGIEVAGEEEGCIY
jgi:hypothetical protein